MEYRTMVYSLANFNDQNLGLEKETVKIWVIEETVKIWVRSRINFDCCC